MKNIISVVDNYTKIDSFYPDDLPEDWRLDFYLNEFEAIFIDNNILNIIEQNDEDLNDLIEDRALPISVVIVNNALEATIEDKTSLITHYGIANKDTNNHKIALSNKQGVDDLAVILIDLSRFENLKKLSEFCQKTISKNKTVQTILIIQTPCTIKQIKDLEILLNLIF